MNGQAEDPSISSVVAPPVRPTIQPPAQLSVHAMPRRKIKRRWPAWGISITLATMCSAWLSLGAWAAYGRIDSFTSGIGRIVPAQPVQVIQTLEGGILADLTVSEGTIVEEGQVVARIADVAVVSEFQQLRSRYLALLASTARLEGEIARRPPRWSDELDTPEGQAYAVREASLYRARMEELRAAVTVIERQRDQRREELNGVDERIRGLRDVLVPLRHELEMTQELADRGFRPRLELIRMQQRVAETTSQVRAATGQLSAIRAAIREAEQRIEERRRAFDSQAQAEISQRHAELAATTEGLRNLRDRVERRDMRAPVRGEVKQIRLKTVGGVLQPGQVLMEIVPTGDSLMVEMPIPPDDIAFVAPGMQARIKVTAYDHTLHGWIGGQVELISADVIFNEKGDAFFQVRVRPERNFVGSVERPLPVLPGMVATVDVVTGSRSVMDYLLKPVLKARDRALTER